MLGMFLCVSIVHRGEWLWNSANFKGAEKGAHIDVEMGQNSAQSFVICSFIMLDWPDTNVFIGSMSNNMHKCYCFVQGQSWKQWTKHDGTMGFITIPLY